MDFHPFNLRRRLIAWRYRRKDFRKVILSCEKLLPKNPNDLFLLERRARANVSLRNWEVALLQLRQIFTIDPNYLDCAYQLARCAIYTKSWSDIEQIAILRPEIFSNDKILNSYNKKLESMDALDIYELVSYNSIINTLPSSIIQSWIELPSRDRPNKLLAIDRYCLDCGIGGPYLGNMLYLTFQRSRLEARITIEGLLKIHPIQSIVRWIGSSLELDRDYMTPFIEWLLIMIPNEKLELSTIGAICVIEFPPPSLVSVVREYLNNCDETVIHEAIRVIGKKSDPRIYVTEESLKKMIQSGVEVHTWMIEHTLRINNRSLLKKIIQDGLVGTRDSVVNSLHNVLKHRSNERVLTLLELVSQTPYLLTCIKVRHAIMQVLEKIAEPVVAHAFAMESIQIEPQDAVSGRVAMNCAVATGNSDLILRTADVVLAMRSRSQRLDYASIAIAAIREGKHWYAEELLNEIRMSSDVRAHRIRIGIPFHTHGDYLATIHEIERTPDKFRFDQTICNYHALSLSHLGRHQEAIKLIQNEIQDNIDRTLLEHIIYRQKGDEESAAKVLNSLMDNLSTSKFPSKWIKGGYDFSLLEDNVSKTRKKIDSSEPLVSVIMTTHRWNDAFSLAIKSILNQSHRNIELIVVDDHSPMKDVKKYDKLLSGNRIVRIRMPKNVGTYACRNKGIESSQGKYITFADSDDWNHPNRIEKALSILEEKNLDIVFGRFFRVSTKGEIQFNGSRLSQFCLVGLMIRKSALEKMEIMFDGRAYFSADSEFYERALVLLGSHKVERYNHIDLIALSHCDSLTGGGANAIDWMGPGETRLRYVSSYRRYHSSLKEGFPPRKAGFAPPSIELLNPSPTSTESRIREIFSINERKRGPKKATKPIRKKTTPGGEIFVFMATYQRGFDTVGRSINSLFNQTIPISKLHLHVNGNKRPPNLPDDERLVVVLSEVDIADNGKFKYMGGHDGYIFTTDDDIDYPHDYVERMIEYVNYFDKKSIVGVHAATLPQGPPVTRWSHYKDLRRTNVFGKHSSSLLPVHILGTGTIAFHSDIGHPDFDQIDSVKMVDLHVAVWATRNGIKLYNVPRKENWLKEFAGNDEDRIWHQSNEDKMLQHDMIRVLNKALEWKNLEYSDYQLQFGPSTAISNWANRELPPLMKLNQFDNWPSLPDNPKVTIYVPAYNTRKYIVECIESALSQTYSNFEVSIHDDGSTDGTFELLHSRYSNNPKVKLSTAENQGIGSATNNAIRNGDGDLILQLDSDDFIEPETLELLVNAIGKNRVCSYGNFRRVKPNGSFIDNGWEVPEYSRERLMREMIIHPPRMFRRDAWNKVGGHDEELVNAEDFDFFLRLSSIGEMVHVRDILYSYRILSTSSTRAQSEKMTTNTLTVIKRELLRQGIVEFKITVPNSDFPRRYNFHHKSHQPV